MNARIHRKLSDLLSSPAVSEWGIADISGLHSLSSEYPKALSIILAYRPEFSTYSENRYYQKENPSAS